MENILCVGQEKKFIVADMVRWPPQFIFVYCKSSTCILEGTKINRKFRDQIYIRYANNATIITSAQQEQY